MENNGASVLKKLPQIYNASEEEDYPYCKESKIIMIDKINPTNYGDLFVQMIPVGWNKVLGSYVDEIRTAGFTLSRQVQRQGKRLVPDPWNIYRAFQLTPWWSVKVVIIGQDPYFSMNGGDPAATGCCFECWPGMPIQHSLENIIMTLMKTIPGYNIPKTGELIKWTQQGVLLLNAALTTNAGEKGAHLEVWSFFILRILQFLSKSHKNLVYMAWGRESQNYTKHIEGDNLILEASHPAARGKHNTFLDCNHFNEANEYLQSHGMSPIDWQL